MRWIAITAAVALLAAGGEAVAQQTPAQQKCINLLNNGMAKVAKASSKNMRKCIAAYAKDVAAPSPDTCSFNAPPKVEAVKDKLEAAGAAVCVGDGLPTVGAANPVNSAFYGDVAARDQVRTIIYGSFGNLVSDVVLCTEAPEGAACRCQDAVLGASNKMLSTWMKLFNKCKKAGLKAETITTAAQLAQCLSDPTKLDPKGKGAKAVTKMNKIIAAKCAAPVTNPMPNGECSTLTGDALGACVNRWARCYACDNLGAADAFGPNINCDLFDDGLMTNSCVDVFD